MNTIPTPSRRRWPLAVTVAVLCAGAAIAQSMSPIAAPPGAPPQAGTDGAAPDRLSAWERRDFGVAAPAELHAGAFHGQTPNRIPGGQVITTQGLVALLQQRELPTVLLHVLDGGPTLPRAVPAPWAAQPGRFDDATQQQLAQLLRQATRGQAEAPLVFYCASPECWMSYNAAVRAIRLGYRNVLWYRGGLAAWQQAGLTLGERGATPPPQAGPGGRSAGALPPDAFGAAGGVRP